MLINRPGKSKEQLLSSLNSLRNNFAKEIADNDVCIESVTDGFLIKAEKKILFMTFWVNAKIKAVEEAYELTWETNVPAGKVNEAIDKVKKVLETS